MRPIDNRFRSNILQRINNNKNNVDLQPTRNHPTSTAETPQTSLQQAMEMISQINNEHELRKVLKYTVECIQYNINYDNYSKQHGTLRPDQPPKPEEPKNIITILAQHIQYLTANESKWFKQPITRGAYYLLFALSSKLQAFSPTASKNHTLRDEKLLIIKQQINKSLMPEDKDITLLNQIAYTNILNLLTSSKTSYLDDCIYNNNGLRINHRRYSKIQLDLTISPPPTAAKDQSERSSNQSNHSPAQIIEDKKTNAISYLTTLIKNKSTSQSSQTKQQLTFFHRVINASMPHIMSGAFTLNHLKQLVMPISTTLNLSEVEQEKFIDAMIALRYAPSNNALTVEDDDQLLNQLYGKNYNSNNDYRAVRAITDIIKSIEAQEKNKKPTSISTLIDIIIATCPQSSKQNQ